jgi:hypothetical protein
MANEDYVYNFASEHQDIKTASTSFNSEHHLNSTDVSIENYLSHPIAFSANNTNNNNANRKSYFYGDNLLANSKNQYEKHLSKSYFDALPHDYEISIRNASETLAETSIFEADYTVHTNSFGSEMSKNFKKFTASSSRSFSKDDSPSQ